MATLLEQLSSQYDIVLIDTPPLLPVTDAAILAKITGGALVIAAADNLHQQQLADGLGALQDVGARVLGMVLNRLAHKPNDAYSYYDYASTGTRAGTKSRQSPPVTSGSTHTRALRPSTRPSSSPSDPIQAPETDQRPLRVSSPNEGNFVGPQGHQG
jgi:Mrp family chromosome partitioning ATPase